jgi:hypothetical protein
VDRISVPKNRVQCLIRSINHNQLVHLSVVHSCGITVGQAQVNTVVQYVVNWLRKQYAEAITKKYVDG